MFSNCNNGLLRQVNKTEPFVCFSLNVVCSMIKTKSCWLILDKYLLWLRSVLYPLARIFTDECLCKRFWQFDTNPTRSKVHQMNLPPLHHKSVLNLFFKSYTLPFLLCCNFKKLSIYLEVCFNSEKTWASTRSTHTHFTGFLLHIYILSLFVINIDRSLNNFATHHNNTLKNQWIHRNDNFL